MISIDLCIIILIIIGCSISTFSDIKYGKISNKVVVAYGSIPIILNWISTFLLDGWISYIGNSIIVIIIAVLLYGFHVWAGGDCKMMIFIALATPVSLYWNYNGFAYNYCFIYAFIFSFGFIYVCFDNINMFYRKHESIDKRKLTTEFRTSIFRYLKAIVYLSAIGQIYLYLIYPYIKIPVVLYTLFCITCIFFTNKVSVLSNKWVVVIIASVDICFFIFTGNITISTMWSTYVIVIALMFLRVVSKSFNYEDISTYDVKRGMILSQETSLLMQRSRVKGLPTVSDESLKSRLNEEEVDAIKRWANSKYGLDSIRIVRKIPFAIFITGGLIAYFIMGCVYF